MSTRSISYDVATKLLTRPGYVLTVTFVNTKRGQNFLSSARTVVRAVRSRKQRVCDCWRIRKSILLIGDCFLTARKPFRF
jgi:hypothetical protein